MSPFAPIRSQLSDKIMLDILSVLLHEAVHVFFLSNACTLCRSCSWNLNIQSHGRAWQLLTSRVENKFIRLTGLPVYLGGFDALRRHWKFVYPLPSLHDISEWRLEDAHLVQLYCCDLLQEYRRCAQPEFFQVRDFCRDWWANSWRKRGRAMAAIRENLVVSREEPKEV